MKKKKALIIDYQSGNILSVKRAIEYLGYEAKISSDKNLISNADRLILPGVGHFGFAMKKLEIFKESILEFLKKKRPFMGICLGMQLLYGKSEEDNFSNNGLNIFKGKVIRFSADDLIIPHIGWNGINLNKYDLEQKIFKNISENAKFYFVHSFHCNDLDESTRNIYSNYLGNKFISSTIKDNVFAFQFHPEKSSTQGLQIYRNFFSI